MTESENTLTKGKGCLMKAWYSHADELRHWLQKQLSEPADTDDLLQEVFVKALLQKENFCSIRNARAWLFRVSKNTLIDRYKLRRENIALPDTLSIEEKVRDTVDGLTQCLPRVLSELSTEDREAITLCDLEHITQQQFAKRQGISLAAAKSRVQRARYRLRKRLELGCQIRFDEKTGDVCCFVQRPPLDQS